MDEEIQAKQRKMLKIVLLEGLVILLLTYYCAVLNSFEDPTYMYIFVFSVIPVGFGTAILFLLPIAREISELNKRKAEEERGRQS